jgi:pimeloyl-ACP methyl ester carboxylesterase
MPLLTLPDCQLYYETHGSGPALIFAHGLGGNHLSWWQQVPYFKHRYQCIVFAHRGFAPSSEPSNGAGPFAFVDDLAALIEHLSLNDVRLVAQSMGGWTCLGYALREPARVKALVMCDTTGALTHPDIDAAFRAARHSNAEASLFARGIHPAAGERMATEQPALHFLYRQIDALSFKLDKPTLRAQLLALRATPTSELIKLTMPTLCITGEEDIVISPEAVARMAALMPNAQLVRVPQAGHSVYFERAVLFNQILDDFFKTIE